MPPSNQQQELAAAVREFYDDFLGAVMFLWPWGKAGTFLAGIKEPDYWQCEFFEWLSDEVRKRAFDGLAPVLPIRAAVSSGHGIGKGALVGMLTTTLMSTREHAKGVITANTGPQLQDKTWPAISYWAKQSLTRDWFEVNTSIMFAKGHRESWKCSPQTCDPDNSESFAGQHNAA